MGQACCKPVTTEGDDRQRPFDADQAQCDLNSNSDDEWWDAASVGSMRSAMSTISLGDALEQWREDLDSDFHDFGGSLALQDARESGGHLVPKEIEDAATTLYASDGPNHFLSTANNSIRDSVACKAVSPPHMGATDGPLVKKMDSYIARQASIPLDKDTASVVAEARKLLSLGRILDAHAKLLHVCTQSGLSLRDLAHHSEEQLNSNSSSLERDQSVSENSDFSDDEPPVIDRVATSIQN